MNAAHPATVADNDQVRVTVWSFDTSGAATGHHVHEFDYVVVPVTGGTFVVSQSDGSVRELTQTAGMPYLGALGTAHDVANTAGQAAVFVEIELKR
jgi:hypothetical protein